MATLTNTKIKDTYDGLLKTTDNDVIGASEKVITDGLGNASVLSIGTGSASFSTDIEVNTLTIGLGSGSIATNTALGSDALLSNTSGSGNVSVGQGSMRSNTSGLGNVSVGKDALRLNTTGNYNVAIGYTSLYSNTTGAYNTAIGIAALYENTEGQNNTAVGYNSANSNTTGLYNTAVGSAALYANETSGNNTALGYFALRNNTAANNTAVGSGALADNTTGGANVAMGKDALNSNTVGSNITAIGRASMSNATSGNNNTAVGFYSLVDNQASNNVAVGDFALRYNTTGGYSTALGSNALIDNTTGGFNTAVGHNSLSSNTTGTRNTSVGKSALLLNIDGERNVALGYGAGTTKTGGDNNIYIGDEADGGSATTSNEIVIGSGATGNGSNTATYGNASITEHHFTAGQVNVSGNLAVDTNTLYVDAANNRVGVGTSSPATKLDIVGSSSADSFIDIIETSGTVKSTFGVFDGGSIGYVGTRSNHDFTIRSNNSERMRIDTSGNVGIGTSSPGGGAKLHILSANGTAYSSNAQLRISSGVNNNRATIILSDDNLSDAKISYAPSAAPAGQLLSLSARSTETDFLLTGEGNVGIGVTPSVKLDVLRGSSGVVANFNGTNAYGAETGITLSQGRAKISGFLNTGGATPGSNLVFYTMPNSGSVTERMRITSGGEVKIGTTTVNSNGLTIEKTGNHMFLRATSAPAGEYWNFDINSNNKLSVLNDNNIGVGINDGDSSWSSVSDESIKENITELTGVLDKIDSYRCVEYNLIGDDKKKIGFIAQDWQADFAAVVNADEDGILSMRYTETIPVLLKAIQELSAKVAALESQLNA